MSARVLPQAQSSQIPVSQQYRKLEIVGTVPSLSATLSTANFDNLKQERVLMAQYIVAFMFTQVKSLHSR